MLSPINPLDPGAAAGIGVGIMILFFVIYLALIGLMIWVGYLITRTAVKNGMKLAMREMGMTFAPHGYAPQAPHAPHAAAPGQSPSAWPQAPAAPASPSSGS